MPRVRPGRGCSTTFRVCRLHGLVLGLSHRDAPRGFANESCSTCRWTEAASRVRVIRQLHQSLHRGFSGYLRLGVGIQWWNRIIDLTRLGVGHCERILPENPPRRGRVTRDRHLEGQRELAFAGSGQVKDRRRLTRFDQNKPEKVFAGEIAWLWQATEKHALKQPTNCSRNSGRSISGRRKQPDCQDDAPIRSLTAMHRYSPRLSRCRVNRVLPTSMASAALALRYN